ncbi:threonine synthase [Nonomuraea soli]|uniref:Threonine synthase n=1 Tax=Nonomuraea soli TaxID=1032476 RepID=A0A7W0HW51_9ACTN|nr:pyridoxal-phosphate dependent enzyme [Nonomuraea soli]MBA2897476.1 threonine synthase [Nonomuraea soli]
MTESLATGQRSLGDPAIRFPLWPPLTAGCPETSTAEVAYPVEVDYDYADVSPELFKQPPLPDIARWAPLLPPLHAPTLGEGGTPLVELDGLFVKDESRNPTWSHKDRLNRVTVSAAIGAGAPGVVVASSGNHGASAAAYAARAGLPAIVLGSAESPPVVQDFLRAYGAHVLSVPAAGRWPLMRQIVERLGYHPVSNLTVTHTGHGFGPEGYKTISYELYSQLGQAPAAVFVPTGYAELIYGVWKGFAELRDLGVIADVPRLYSCEPATSGPLAVAFRSGQDTAKVDYRSSDAYSIGASVSGYRGVVALRGSGGQALTLSDEEMAEAQRWMAARGMWAEMSGAASVAGFRQLGRSFDGPVVCVSTSSGLKDKGVGERVPATAEATWESVERLINP